MEDKAELFKDFDLGKSTDHSKEKKELDELDKENIETTDTADEQIKRMREQDIDMRDKILEQIHRDIESKNKVRNTISWAVFIYIFFITVVVLISIFVNSVDVKVKTVLATVILGNTIGIITYFCKYAFSDSEALINLFHKINMKTEDNEKKVE